MNRIQELLFGLPEVPQSIKDLPSLLFVDIEPVLERKATYQFPYDSEGTYLDTYGELDVDTIAAFTPYIDRSRQ